MQQATLAQAFETISYEKRGATAYVTMNRPTVLNNQRAIVRAFDLVRFSHRTGSHGIVGQRTQ
jgi:1,4-dihydroxy-2-naphthoyl-CoA synthase